METDVLSGHTFCPISPFCLVLGGFVRLRASAGRDGFVRAFCELGYAVRRGLPAHALLPKADKLGRGAAGNALLAVKRELSNAFGDTVGVQLFSGESKQGVDALRDVVAGWLDFTQAASNRPLL